MSKGPDFARDKNNLDSGFELTQKNYREVLSTAMIFALNSHDDYLVSTDFWAEISGINVKRDGALQIDFFQSMGFNSPGLDDLVEPLKGLGISSILEDPNNFASGLPKKNTDAYPAEPNQNIDAFPAVPTKNSDLEFNNLTRTSFDEEPSNQLSRLIRPLQFEAPEVSTVYSL